MLILHLVEGEFNRTGGKEQQRVGIKDPRDIVDVTGRQTWRRWLEENGRELLETT